MKQILVEIDDSVARDLERIAPTKARRRARFIRLAIQRAVDLALDRQTEAAYRAQPDSTALDGWDPQNALARPAGRRPKAARARRAA